MEYVLKEYPKAPFPIKLPKGIEEYAHSCLNHPIIYNRFKRRAFCPACGEYFSYTAPGEPLPTERTVYMMHIVADKFVKCPLCGNEGRSVPHTRNSCVNVEICTGRAEKGVLYLTIISASYFFKKENFDNLRSLEAKIIVEEIGEIGRDHQRCFLNYGEQFRMTSNPFVHHEISHEDPYIHPSFCSAVKRSCLRYAGIEIGPCRDYDINKTIKRLALNAKHPQMEYLKKAGLGEIEKAMVYGHPTYLKLNWKKTDLPGVLGITSQDIDKLKQWKMWHMEFIAAYKMIKKYHRQVRKNDLEVFFGFFNDIGIFVSSAKFEEDLRGHDPLKTAAYLRKIYEENMPCCSHGAYGYSKFSVLREYKDYIHQLRALEYPETDYYLYPKDLKGAHDRVSEEFRNMENEKKQREKAALQAGYEEKYLPALKDLTYSDGTFLIRPLVDYEEFKKEGQNNVNCVASYYDRVAHGQSAVFVIRRVDAPEVSLVTVEIKGENMVQCRAKGNREPDKEVRAFADRWMKNVVKKEKGKGKAA